VWIRDSSGTGGDASGAIGGTGVSGTGGIGDHEGTGGSTGGSAGGSTGGSTGGSPGSTGGGTVTVAVPAGVTEVLVNFRDATSGAYATKFLPNPGAAAGTLTATIPAGTFASGDSLRVQAIGFDYADYELGPPNNTSQTPPMPASADMTVSTTVSTTA